VPVLCEPLLALEPPQSPLAVQEVGLLVAFQLSVALLPTVIDEGLTVKDTDGGLGST
jgi:hypothetical protein